MTISASSRITPADFRWFPMAIARRAAHHELWFVSNGALRRDGATAAKRLRQPGSIRYAEAKLLVTVDIIE
jgi:hypothetical protein